MVSSGQSLYRSSMSGARWYARLIWDGDRKRLAVLGTTRLIIIDASVSLPNLHHPPRYSLTRHALSIMDVDGPSSSPPVRQTSLPPSSAPQPSASSNGHSTPRRPRPVADALAFDNDDAEDAQAEEEGGRTRRGRGRAQGNAADIPLVRDPVGESVREAFETFLKTYAHIFLQLQCY